MTAKRWLLGVLVLAVASAGCDIALADFKAKQSAEWKKTYELAPGGRFVLSLRHGPFPDRRRKFEAGLMTKEQYELTLQNRGPEYIAPMVAFLATDDEDFICCFLFQNQLANIFETDQHVAIQGNAIMSGECAQHVRRHDGFRHIMFGS